MQCTSLLVDLAAEDALHCSQNTVLAVYTLGAQLLGMLLLQGVANTLIANLYGELFNAALVRFAALCSHGDRYAALKGFRLHHYLAEMATSSVP